MKNRSSAGARTTASRGLCRQGSDARHGRTTWQTAPAATRPWNRAANPANLNRVMLDVRQNAHTNRITPVHVTCNPASVPDKLRQGIQFLDEAYPEIDIECVVQPGMFGPELIRQLSSAWGIAPNFMCIGYPGHGLPHSLAERSGVRVII